MRQAKAPPAQSGVGAVDAAMELVAAGAFINLGERAPGRLEQGAEPALIKVAVAC
jgi:hypothetical protein